MWVFYLISLPATLGTVAVTLRYFAGPDVPRYVLAAVGYAWFCSLSIIILVPADIWTTIVGRETGGIGFFWSWSYWSTFLLTWAVVPTIQGYEDAGDFTVKERLRTSIRVNLVFYIIVASVGLFGLILLIIMHRNWTGNIVGLAMACSNTFGLVTGAFLLGFGLSEIPKSIWRNADWSHRQKLLSHRVANMALKFDNAHQELSNAVVVAQATSNQISKRDPLKPYMNIIDKMLLQMLQDDPSFKPSGGKLGQNDMDYDTDEKTMAALRRQLRKAREEYYRCRSEYINTVVEALELEDTIKNYEQRDSNGWKYISSFRESRTGRLGSFLDIMEFSWRCILRKQLQELSAVILGCMSAAILLAEATLLPSGVDLSLFSLLINAVGRNEMPVQIAAFVPLLYMCICTYYSLFKMGMLMFYSLTPRQTSSVSLLMICSMVARYAPPISYNFLNLIRLGGNAKTIFEERMGNIDDAVPFFGKGFNNIYPLIMVIYTLLVATNFFDRMIEYFGSWKISKFQSEEENSDGFDPSGLIILRKERSWLEQGHKVGEQVVPLARSFSGADVDVESGNLSTDKSIMEVKSVTTMPKENGVRSQIKFLKEESQKYGNGSEALTKEGLQIANSELNEKVVQPSVALLKAGISEEQSDNIIVTPRTGLSWASMKTGFNNFRNIVGARRFMPLRQTPETTLHGPVSSSESLDEIFERLKQRPMSDPDEDLEFVDDSMHLTNS